MTEKDTQTHSTPRYKGLKWQHKYNNPFQIHEKVDYNQRNRQFDEEQQKRHYESWDSFWGRPGYGAPKHGAPSKGNLMKMLHYPDKVGHMLYLN